MLEPHQFWSGSKERGAAWTTIAENLKAFDMKVSQHSVRERFEKIIKEFKAKEARAIGVDVEYTECDKLLTNVVEKMEEFEEAMEKVKKSSRLREREIAQMENQMLRQQQFQRTLLEQQQQFQQQQQNVTLATVTALSELVKNMRK